MNCSMSTANVFAEVDNSLWSLKQDTGTQIMQMTSKSFLTCYYNVQILTDAFVF